MLLQKKFLLQMVRFSDSVRRQICYKSYKSPCSLCVFEPKMRHSVDEKRTFCRFKQNLLIHVTKNKNSVTMFKLYYK